MTGGLDQWVVTLVAGFLVGGRIGLFRGRFEWWRMKEIRRRRKGSVDGMVGSLDAGCMWIDGVVSGLNGWWIGLLEGGWSGWRKGGWTGE